MRRTDALVCRPEVPGQPFLCPGCGGGAPADALHQPEVCIERITAAGQTVPFWLEVLRERVALLSPREAEPMSPGCRRQDLNLHGV